MPTWTEQGGIDSIIIYQTTDDKISDLVTFVIHAAQEEDVGRTQNRGTSPMMGESGRFFEEGRIKVGFKERARINSPKTGKWTSILGEGTALTKALRQEGTHHF